MPANDKSDWQIEKNKQKTTTTKCGHRCSRSAFGKVRFSGQKCHHGTKIIHLSHASILLSRNSIVHLYHGDLDCTDYYQYISQWRGKGSNCHLLFGKF